MIPPIPQPDPMPLPAPGWLLWALLMLTFLLHLVPMNLVLGGSILGAIARVRSRDGERPHEATLAHLVVKAMPVLISATVTFGVAALLFLQVLYGRVFFPSAIVMGWWWLSVIGVLILAYYAAYLLAYREDRLGGAGTGLAWLIAAVAGLIALIYGNNMTLMLKPQEIVTRYLADGRGVQLNLSDPTLVPRHLHMVLGALAVSGLAVAVVGVLRRKADPAFASWAVKYGAFYCGLATSVNIFAGLWWLAALPREVILQFMGGNPTPIIVLLAGILLTVSGAGALVMAASGRQPVLAVSAGVATLLTGIAMMLLTRDTVRNVSLAIAGFQPATWTAPQWGPIAIFGVLLVGAVVTVVWMVGALVRSPKTSP
ncbi:MAG: hypothetical protein NTY02_00205 [Acidobacteria bacterium]|nr:hypothetical protein [Acidobacteriota bacterium]